MECKGDDTATSSQWLKQVFMQFDDYLEAPLVPVLAHVLVRVLRRASVQGQHPWQEAASFAGLHWRAYQADRTEYKRNKKHISNLT